MLIASMTLHLTCAFEVIKFPNERVIALFHHFLLQFLRIMKSVKKLITPRLQDPFPVHFTNIDKTWGGYVSQQ